MPQVCTEGYPRPVLPGTGNEAYELKSLARSEGRLKTEGPAIALRKESHGIMGALAKVLSRTAGERRTAEDENMHLARLPKVATDKIMAYLADPFERATLAMTCRHLHQQLKPYWPEFQLFRDLIAGKKSLDYRSPSSYMSEVRLLLNFFTGHRWNRWRARTVFEETFKRLGRMYPYIPERVFHEVWPLFDRLTKDAKLEVLHDVYRDAMARSPYWAITVLTEFARRTAFLGVRANFHDTLLRLAVPLLQDPKTAKDAEPLIGAIAQAQRYGGSSRVQEQARWKRILELLPPSTSIDSPAVLGLAKSALGIQRRWEKHGRDTRYGFPAVTMMQERFKGFPTDDAIDKSTVSAYQHNEMEIDNRRRSRYMRSERYATDRARGDRRHQEIVAHLYTRSVVPWCETAGGGC